MRILAVTEYYNEVDNIPSLVDNISSQTQPPDLWLIIDDGSTDDSTSIFKKSLRHHKIPYITSSMPQKEKPNANLKGRAFNKVEILNNEWVNSDRFDYLILIGADTLLPPTYIEQSTTILQDNKEFGVLGGRIRDEPGSVTPMGTGKVVRWDIIQSSSGRYWDLDPDSLWNIISLELGYKLLIVPDLIINVTRPTHMYSPLGHFNYGKRMYYVGWNLLSAIIYSLVLLARKSHATHFLRGYLHSRMYDNNWLCNDPSINYYYSLSRMIRRILSNTYNNDSATFLSLQKPGTSDNTDLTYLGTGKRKSRR